MSVLWRSRHAGPVLQHLRSGRLPARLKGLTTKSMDDPRIRSKAPVFLVHGFRVFDEYVEEESSLELIEKSLRKRGHEVFKFAYESKNDTIQGHAQSLVDFVHSGLQASSAQHAARSLGLVSHSFGAILIRAAMRCEGWKRIESSILPRSAELRCVMIAPPNQGSSLARLLRPREQSKSMWEYAVNQAASSLSDSFLGRKAGRELQDVEEGRGDWSFGILPGYCRTLVIAGDCGGINPLLHGPNDGVITVEETRMCYSAHAHLVVTAPHNYITQHPAAVRATLDFIAGASVPAACYFPGSSR